MVAVVLKNKSRHGILKTYSEKKGRMCIISVGDQVGQLRLRRALKPFGNDFIFARNVETRGIIPYDTSDFRRKFLFKTFFDYVKSQQGYKLKIGIHVESEDLLAHIFPLISHTAETVLLTKFELDEFCNKCLIQVGTCPEVVSEPAQLSDCDVIFAPEGTSFTNGIVFDMKTLAPSPQQLHLPKYCNSALAGGVDAVDLAALLSLEDKTIIQKIFKNKNYNYELFS